MEAAVRRVISLAGSDMALLFILMRLQRPPTWVSTAMAAQHIRGSMQGMTGAWELPWHLFDWGNNAVCCILQQHISGSQAAQMYPND